MMLKKVENNSDISIMIHVNVLDVRELLRLEGILKKCGEFSAKSYLYGRDEWGRNTIRSASYIIKFKQREDLRRLKIRLTENFSDSSKLLINF